MVPGFSSGNTHIDFQVVDGTFHNSSDFVKGIPFIGIPLNAGKHAEIQIFICIGGVPLFGCTARIIAVACPLSFFILHPGASPFNAIRPSFFLCDSKMFHCERAVIGAGRIAVFVVTNFFQGTFISWVIRNENP